MWQWISAVFASKELPRNKAGDIIVDPRDRTYGISCTCCETYFKVTGRKVQKCRIGGFKADCPTCSEVNFFDGRNAV